MKITKILPWLALTALPVQQILALSPTSTYSTPCSPSATITSLSNTYGCFSYSASISGTPSINAYFSWNFGDGNTAVGNVVYHCYPSCSITTIYSVTVSYNSPVLCGPNPTQQIYTLSLNPAPQNICAGATPSMQLAASSVTVYGGVGIPEIYTSYIFGDGSGSTPTNTHTYASCGNYIIQIKRNDLLINPPDSCYYYTAVNIACNTSDVGIPTYILKQELTRLFPNPTSEILNIRSEKVIQDIEVIDLLGKCTLWQNDINESQTLLKIQDVHPGTYFVKLVYQDGSEEHLKFIKK